MGLLIWFGFLTIFFLASGIFAYRDGNKVLGVGGILMFLIYLVVIFHFHTHKDFGYRVKVFDVRYEKLVGDELVLVSSGNTTIKISNISDYKKFVSGEYGIYVIHESNLLGTRYHRSNESEYVLIKK